MKSVLIVSGNDPKAQLDATLYGAEALLYDLHESVDASNKDAARILMQEALAFYDFGTADVCIRTNPMESCGTIDIGICGKGKPSAFVIPQASLSSIAKADAVLTAVETENGFAIGSIKLLPAVGSASAVAKSNELIASCSRITALLFHAPDFLQDLGVAPSADSEQLVYARSTLSLACHAAGILAIDTPFLDLKDTAGLKADAIKAKSLGFAGKVAISGAQVPLINTLFS